jgi:RHS repeat-associated protein
VSTAVSGEDTSTVVRHYADATDAPAFVVATGPDGVAKTTWYGTGLADDLGVTVTDGVTTVQLADIHGDIAIPVTLDAGEVVAIGGFADFDEYGRPLAGTATPDTGGVSYGWLGGQERATDEATGLMLMGVRLYNPNTGLFTSVDPVPGGNTTAYTYPQDPINKFDLDGKAWGWAKKLKKAAKAVAKVAEIASFIPGPIGMAAAGVATAGYLAAGDYKKAASAAVGLIPGGKLIATAVKVGKSAVKVAKKAKALKRKKKSKGKCNSFEAGTPIVMADGTDTPVEDIVIGDEVLSSDGTVQSVQPVIGLIRYQSERLWVDLTITTVEGASPLVTTDEHPFWVLDGTDAAAGLPVGEDTTGAWVNAVDLKVGDVLLTASGETALVSGTQTRESVEWAYNFTVANTHTYYAGDEPVLTHNAQACPVTFSAHALRQMRGGRGDGVRYTPKMVVKDAIRHPVSLMPQVGKTVYRGRGATAVVNRSMNVVTAWGRPFRKKGR